jgi:hypothetical protein
MTKCQKRALNNLQQEVKLEQDMERKTNTDINFSDEEDITQPKKRPRGDELQDTQQSEINSIFPACTYCHQLYELDILEKHQTRCPKRTNR